MQTLFERLEHWANVAPDKLAVNDGVNVFTYKHLLESSERYASKLRSSGVIKGDHVVIAFPKSIEAIAAIFGTLSVGAVYIPIDLKAPISRIQSIIDDSSPALVLGLLPEDISITKKELETDTNSSNFECCNSTDRIDIAYILYTSGTTGIPNGVRISQEAVLSFFNAVNSYMGVNFNSRCLSTSALYFDVSVVDIFLPLYQGSSVWLGPDIPSPARLLHLLNEFKITHLCGVGSLLTLISSMPRFKSVELDSLKVIMTGAEIISPKTIKQWISKSNKLKILNGYGPTEATCVSTVFVIDETNYDKFTSYPIGNPLPGIEVLIEGLQQDNSEGELLISGKQVAKDYLNRNELNLTRFLTINNKRFYRTGDKVKLSENNNLLFLGRLDQEIKIRGYRVNLNEVSNPYRSMKEVFEAHAVLVQNEIVGDLIAIFVKSSISESDSVNSLYRGRKKLLSYMQPKIWISVDNFPKKPTGKTDISQLAIWARTNIKDKKIEQLVFSLESLARDSK